MTAVDPAKPADKSAKTRRSSKVNCYSSKALKFENALQCLPHKKQFQLFLSSWWWLIFIIVSVLFQVSQLLESPVHSSTPVDDADFVEPADKSSKKRSNSKVSWLWIEISARQWQLCASSLISTQLKNCLKTQFNILWLLYYKLFCFRSHSC